MSNEKMPVNLENREELEKRLAKARQRLSDMELDLKNGRYPNPVPVEYHDQMDALNEEITNLEMALEELNK